MIMQGTTPRALTWHGLFGLFVLGLFLLPVMPSWGQEGADQPIRVQVAPPGADANKAQAELERLMAELKKKEAELKQLQLQVQEAQRAAYSAEKEKRPGVIVKDQPQDVIVLELVDGNSRQVIKLPAGSRVLGGDRIDAKRGDTVISARVLREAELKKALDALAEQQKGLSEAELKKAREAMEKQLAELKARVQQPPRGLIIEIISDGKRQVIELPPGSRVLSGAELPYRELKVVPALPKPGDSVWGVVPKAGQPVPVVPGYQPVPRPPATDTEKRLNDLEKRLEELMRAVKELRGELQKGKPGAKTDVRDPKFQLDGIEVPLEILPVKPADPNKH